MFYCSSYLTSLLFYTPLAQSCYFALLAWSCYFTLLVQSRSFALLAQNCCSSLLVQSCCSILLIRNYCFALLVRSCCFTPFPSHYFAFFVWNYCSILLVRSYYSAPLGRHVALLFLLDILFFLYCSTCYSIPLARCHYSSYSMLLPFLFHANVLLLLLDVVAPLVQQCCSLFTHVLLWYTPHFVFHCSFCFKLVFPHFIFLQVLKNCPNSNSSSQIWKARIVFSIFVCWWVFLTIHVFGKWWLTIYLFVLYRNYLDILHLIIHIASHFYTFHFLCTIAFKCIFSANYIFKKILSTTWFSCRWQKNTYF